MDRKCSAGSSHRAMGIVEEAIVLLFLYFSTRALLPCPDLASYISFFRSISLIPYPASLYVTKCSIAWIISLGLKRKRERERENKMKQGKRVTGREEGGGRARWRKRD